MPSSWGSYWGVLRWNLRFSFNFCTLKNQFTSVSHTFWVWDSVDHCDTLPLDHSKNRRLLLSSSWSHLKSLQLQFRNPSDQYLETLFSFWKYDTMSTLRILVLHCTLLRKWASLKPNFFLFQASNNTPRIRH